MDKKRVYAVSTAHLDTVWRWELDKTLTEYIPDTISKNFDLFEKYPNYKFNFEGAYRYKLIEEFYPLAFEQIKKYIDEGKWCISGTAFETGDVNIASPEAILRNILLGDKYFKTKFGKSSKDLFLPDCFGFSWALPTIASHAGLKGITTQKLSWGSAYGIPFDLGIWQGPDGSKIYACLDAKSYRYKFNDDIRADLSVINKIIDNNNSAELPWANHLYGTGDWGGAPTEESVQAVEKSIAKNEESDFEVISARTDQVFEDMDKLSKADKAKLPVWNNELPMTSHAAGTYTSRCISKRLNRQCERMADYAEKACVMASSIDNFIYPRDILNEAWERVVRHQFHDDITGTSTMKVYNDSWNDYYLSLSQFKNEYLAASRATIDFLDTSWIDDDSITLVVNNPTQYKQKRNVEATVKVKRNCMYVAVFDKDGNEVPSQVIKKEGKTFSIVFQADVDSFGYRVYRVSPAKSACKITTDLKVTQHSLENDKYEIIFNKNGDIAYLYDKKLKRQIIDKPIKMALLHDTGQLSYPSWEIRKEDIDAQPYCYANTPKFSIIENGPVRIAIKVSREAEYSTIEQVVSLSAESEYIEVNNYVDWKTRRTILKATFPLAAHSKQAAYDIGVGVINRGNNTDNLYEVPAQKWADISDNQQNFGVSIFSDSKYGWDKPDDNTLRLTCIHTPAGAFTKDARQDLQDLGRNIFSFAIYSHEGNYQSGTQKNCELYSNPLMAVQTTRKADGYLGDKASYASISCDDVIVKALKRCEYDDSIIIRVVEANGKAHRNVKLRTYLPLGKAELVNGVEEHVKDITLDDSDTVKFNIKPFEIKTFKLTYAESPRRYPRKKYNWHKFRKHVNAKGLTTDYNMRHVILQGSGFSLPFEEMTKNFSREIAGIRFYFLQEPEERFDVLVCRGQRINVPKSATQLHFIAASTLGDQEVEFTVGKKKKVPLTIRSIKDNISTWDMAGMNQVGDVRQNERLAIEFNHTHHPEGNIPTKARFNLYTLNIKDAASIRLPENNRIVILALTAVREDSICEIATSIEDTTDNGYAFYDDIPPIDKIIDKADFVTIRAGKIQDQIKSGKGQGFKRDNIITNIIRSYTKSEW